MWSTGEGNGKPLQYSFLKNPMNSMKKLKGMTWEEEPSQVGSIWVKVEKRSVVDVPGAEHSKSPML